MTAFVLAGGLGTRIAELYSGLPKAMIPVGARPFINYVLEQLSLDGIKDVVVCAGYKASMLVEHVERMNRPGVSIVVEPEPLGTAGALAFAPRECAHPDETFLALNGDTYAEFDPGLMLEQHRDQSADATLACYFVPNAEGRGTVYTPRGTRITEFREKAARGPALVSGGVYALEPRILANVPSDRPMSLEVDVFPAVLASGGVLEAWKAPGHFWDMGTPEGLRAAEARLS